MLRVCSDASGSDVSGIYSMRQIGQLATWSFPGSTDVEVPSDQRSELYTEYRRSHGPTDSDFVALVLPAISTCRRIAHLGWCSHGW